MIAQEKKKLDKGPPLDLALVNDFVGAAHAKLNKTQEMLAAQPALLNATWDWAAAISKPRWEERPTWATGKSLNS